MDSGDLLPPWASLGISIATLTKVFSFEEGHMVFPLRMLFLTRAYPMEYSQRIGRSMCVRQSEYCSYVLDEWGGETPADFIFGVSL
jgi:hypothetical protein